MKIGRCLSSKWPPAFPVADAKLRRNAPSTIANPVRSVPKQKEDARMYRSCVCVALASSFVLSGLTQPMAQVACTPALTFKEVRFSKAQNQLRTWTGILSADATRCATTSGPFEITFVRGKELGPDRAGP